MKFWSYFKREQHVFVKHWCPQKVKNGHGHKAFDPGDICKSFIYVYVYIHPKCVAFISSDGQG